MEERHRSWWNTRRQTAENTREKEAAIQDSRVSADTLYVWEKLSVERHGFRVRDRIGRFGRDLIGR